MKFKKYINLRELFRSLNGTKYNRIINKILKNKRRGNTIEIV